MTLLVKVVREKLLVVTIFLELLIATDLLDRSHRHQLHFLKSLIFSHFKLRLDKTGVGVKLTKL